MYPKEREISESARDHPKCSVGTEQHEKCLTCGWETGFILFNQEEITQKIYSRRSFIRKSKHRKHSNNEELKDGLV
jgi:hypothetical protein